ncbi:unnamed protein product [Diatraea saccharalis]|uniref:Uncharacterized protein n=1 Tax=Diatraea saccharalis TaxID=40085 RepID=A0A9N9N2L5_9NEOP|nr:unnamed protein product [Diatraea saccharalis]
MEIEQLIFERDLAINSIQRTVDCSDNESEFRVRSKELNNIKKCFFQVQIKIEKLQAKDGSFNKDEQLKIRNHFDTLYYNVQTLLDNLKETQRRQSVIASASVKPPCSYNRSQCSGHSFSHIRLPKLTHIVGIIKRINESSNTHNREELWKTDLLKENT